MFSTDLLKRRVLPTTKGGRHKSSVIDLITRVLSTDIIRFPRGTLTAYWFCKSLVVQKIRNYIYSILDTE
ncbi:hypothetical protein PanWU01x14_161710 [Parasponia andersonii]|uniref:Uncharacterized protein n=1 Tax=Parasponia andersonii TaxID=3476 RepID=A0A2P5CDC7_PARAD|nr:hypothetical protein PanWU01x14_161710 [Parasponia andersonii]